MKRFAIALFLFAASALPAMAQEYYDVDVNLPEYPEMQPVPDSPVYYAPAVDSNYFYYDGLYWDYYNDGWYSSAWYNGPWTYVDPVYVPTYILWVPISYYHHRPGYWRGWASNRPPRWGDHWGHDWQARHNQVYGGRNARPAQRAPLPTYQRQFTSQNYPRAPQQQMQIHHQNYAYQPREAVTQQHYQARSAGGPVPGARVPAQAAGSLQGERHGGAERGGPR